jgi:hypothetical protein
MSIIINVWNNSLEHGCRYFIPQYREIIYIIDFSNLFFVQLHFISIFLVFMYQ